VVVGADALAVADGAAKAGGDTHVSTVADADSAAALVREGVRSGDVVLVKASNAERLWRVADRLVDRTEQDASAATRASA